MQVILAQTNPAITSWLQNTTGITGRHYVSGNSTPIVDATLANVQTVKYSTNWVYVSTNGIPSYVTGPFLDGNPNNAGSQNAIFKIPLTPVQNTGTLTATTGGNIGIFINGVALFDYRDGVSWKNSASALCGGPIMGCTGDGVWNRDAVVGEKGGFDCSKGHPAGTNYHHHQNPSAFKLDLTVISTICNLYNADGLYSIDSTTHSPLIGFAYDGFPIYGAYGYKNSNGTGGIVRMKSSWTKRNISVRNTYYTGVSVTPGPNVSTTYPIGYFKEDYQFITPSPSNQDSLDIHNGRFCITPEYPGGTYAYFCTVDENWNSTYPYIIGPTYYGIKSALKVTSITESVSTYSPTLSISITSSATTICSGTNVTFNATAVNGGISPTYQWKKNGVNVGTNNSSYSNNSLVNGDIITCVITTAAAASATSNSISINVIATSIPTISIISSSSTICAGATVFFNASVTNGGSTPSYQWKKNGNNVGSNLFSYSDNSLSNNDVINCILTSNANCTLPSIAISNNITMIVNDSVTPSIIINASMENICSQSNVIFNSIIQNGGSNPVFQWKLNNINTGDGSNSYSNSNLVPGDSISCEMTSNVPCFSSPIVSSNTITMTCVTSITLNLKIFIDGYYDNSNHTMIPLLYNTGNSTNNLEVDTITVELHSASSPYSMIESSKGILKVDGTCSVVYSPDRFGLPYYIVLKHRNALETWSKIPIVLDTITEYDFTH